LNEIAEAAGLTFEIEEKLIPVREDVRAACEILGLDFCQVACEGRFVIFVPEHNAARTLEVMREHPSGDGPCRIGKVSEQRVPRVLLKSTIGVQRILDMSSGEQLPRIC
jgi:hydrogenase expression/formation protein HypE